ncbi:MAG: transcriptional regulator [candidate division Zixibacteria bacterium]|nr:transcriptional regulator [candidate division Zixibacteria bacterium]
MTEHKSNGENLKPKSTIDKLIHEPARLNIMSYLYVVESADFLFLMNQTGLTKGNLSSHLSKLEEADYVEIEKKFVSKIPRTFLRLTYKGRNAFNKYRRNMKQMLDDLPD